MLRELELAARTAVGPARRHGPAGSASVGRREAPKAALPALGAAEAGPRDPVHGALRGPICLTGAGCND